MKKSILFILLALSCICGFAQSIDPVLLQEMDRRTDDEKIQVVVIMKSQYDRQQLGRSASNFATRAERRDFVVNELKRFAETSQYDLRMSLNEMERNGMTTAPTNLWMANALSFTATKQAINDLAVRSDIEIIGYDEMRYALFDEEQTSAQVNRGIANHVTKVNADDVWNLGYTGQGIVVAILDSGVNYNHVDLANHLWDGGSEYPNHGYDFVYNDNDPMDDNGRGTHSAGIICGDGTAGTQTGIAPGATLMCVKVLNSSGNGSVATVCNAMQWAVEQGCDVLNMAFGWSNSSIAERTLLRNTCVSVLNAGVIASVAAGDRGGSSSYPIPNNITLPGSCPPPYMDSIQAYNSGGLSCAITVGAVDNSDYIRSSSSRGPVTWSDTEYGDYIYTEGSTTAFGLIRPDVCAPGYGVISTYYNNTTGYDDITGTAPATSCVSGCISLLLSKNINATPAQICEALEKTAYSRETGKTNNYGYGRVDVLAAINSLSAGPLSLEAVNINDVAGNNDHKLNAGESVSLQFALKNNSEAAFNGISMVLTSESEYVTITNGTATLPNISSGQTRIVDNIFSFSLSDDAPSGEQVWFAAEATLNGESLGILRFSLLVYGHSLVFNQVTITNDTNGNNSLEPGESATLHVVISNTGNEPAQYVLGTLSSTFPQLTINSNNQSFGTIAVGGQGSADFNVSLASNAPDSYTIDLSLDLLDGYSKHTQVDFDIWRMAITTTSDPVGAGILTGGGNFGAGQSCTLTAIPSSSNYVFSNWTKNGEIKSHYPSYTFNVTEGAEYVAHFKQIDGIAIGEPTSSSSYVPSYAYYRYSMTQQIYTASEMGGQPGNIANVSFYNTYSGTTRNLTIYMVHTNKDVFNSNTDWIQVTEANKVFSGTVSFTSRGWTTIYFNTPFAYNGTSNVALIVDDNTNSQSYSSNSMRTFNANENLQALYIYSDNTDYIPNHYYSGNRWKYKNQVVFGYASYEYTITASANPTNGGTVSGPIGQSYYGRPITLTATPNIGYVFDNWIKNNNNNNTTYYPNNSFSVTESADYVANFQHLEGLAIGVATSSSGYLPMNSLRYSLTQQIYTVAEMGGQSRQINSVSFYNISSSSSTRDSVTIYLVHTPKSSFDNDTDWITVTEADEVFNGNVTFSHGWMTIFFDRVFEYDGTSNLAMVVHTNSSTSGAYITGRTFPTYSNNQSVYQSIRIYNSNTSYDPFNPSNYSGIRESAKNEIVFGSATGNYTVTVTANPQEYGTVSGGGSGYYLGQSCTVTATPNEGYCFLNWKINGTVVSNDATYTFPVSGDMVLEANFGIPVMITAVVNPEGSGTVTGAGGYAPGQTCTLTAIPNEGYVFLYWRGSGYNSYGHYPSYNINITNYTSNSSYTAYFKQLNENEFLVGDNPSATSAYLPDYMNSNYSLTQQIYTAAELGGARTISSVSFYNTTTNTTYNRDIDIYLVQTTKTAFNNENDWIPVTEANKVFSGTFKPAYHSWSTIYFNTPFIYNGTSNLALIIYDKTNTTTANLSFRTFATEGSQAIRVNGDNPINTSGPTEVGTLMTEKNQIILGSPVYGYSLALSADPANGGTVSGPVGDDHFYGQPITITATPNSGYVFKSWTKRNNTNAVSYLSPATLSITESVEYVAHFVAMDGIVVGEPNRTNTNLPIKINSHNYSLSQQIYTAEELNTNSCQISSVSFFNSGYSPTRDLTVYMVNTTKAAYDNMSDWISVSDSDIVFEGSVDILSGNWTTVYFNTPFIYDGTSNVALMVYDHTASYSSDLNSRTFSTTTNQAICANDTYAINPTNPVVVSTLLSEKNQVVFGVANYDYTMTLSAEPEEGGSVSVNNDGLNGYYYYGQPLTISATPNQGYVFNEWTKSYVGNNGNTQNATVSYFSTSDIALTETADYVAHFQQMDGIIIGEAAKTNENFPFGEYYNNSLTQQIYTAEELNTNACQISSFSFFNTQSSRNRVIDVYMVNTTKNTFDSTTDWIAVTEADLVFSGSLSVTGYDWTTVFFNTPFDYDGSSNVALVINNRTTQYSGYGPSCRTFDTEGAQAIYGHKSNESFDPTAPTGYGNLYTEKNQIVFGVVSYDYPVTTSANPSEGGTTSIIGNSINGKYYYGQPITLTASANPGYAFSTWKKGNDIVTCYPEHNLNVTDSTNYEANFKQFDGIIIGEPSHAESHLPSYYNTSLTQQIYTASEMGGQACDISSISFFNTGTSTSYRYNVDIFIVNTDKMSFDSITDWIPVPQNTQALYSGRVTFTGKNWITVYFPTPFHYDGTSNVALIIRDNTKTYDTSISCRTFDTDTTQVLRVYSTNNTVYDPYNPTGSGTLLSVKNQVVFGRANYNCYIIGSANPTNGGWVTGDWGAHYYGQPFTLTASPMPGYVFTNIEKDGVVVSHVPTYSFTVTESATFVANFKKVDGVAIGEPAYTSSSNLPYYYYNSLTQQIYTTAELGTTPREISSVSFYNAGSSNGVRSKIDLYLAYTSKTTFDSITDWIAVDSVDMVFSGSINVLANNWTTINFNKVFNYDGSSNVVLVVDNNYGSYNSINLNGRTFGTEGNQAIIIYSSSIDYDPSNPTGYSGTLMTQKNQVIFGPPSRIYSVNVTADPTTGGTVSGGGEGYFLGELCTVTASANEGYVFNNWTLDGNVVSSDETYSFPVTGNANLVANFGVPINITVTANPTEGGVVIGGGGYGLNHSCTLTATANPGYVFTKWTYRKNNSTYSSFLSPYTFSVTEELEVVAHFDQVNNGVAIGDASFTNGYLPNYDTPYSLTQQIFTASEMGNEAQEISSVSFFSMGYSRTRNLTVYMVHTDKTSFADGSDWIPVTEDDMVYSGDVYFLASNWTSIYFSNPFSYDGSSNVAIVVDDNTGSYFNWIDYCRTFSTDGNQAIHTHSSSTNYDPCDPTDYSGTLMSEKNQVIFGYAIPEYTVNVSSNNTAYGMVSGAEGMYYLGQPCTVTATPNPGYIFYYWKNASNNSIVSYDETYTFQVVGNMSLTAYFGPAIQISVSADPAEGGTVSGGGEYAANHSCTLTATPNPGYVFVKWMKTNNSYTVTYLSTYNFTVSDYDAEYVAIFEPEYPDIVIGDAETSNEYLPTCDYNYYCLTEQIYTAEEIGTSGIYHSISFFNKGYESTRNLTIYMKHTDKSDFSNQYDWVSVTTADQVFSGTVTMTRGEWTEIILDSPFYYDGTSNIVIAVDDNTGEYSYNLSCRAFNTDSYQGICVYDYNDLDPFSMTEYWGDRFNTKSQIKLGCSHTITATADPTEGGTVIGGGICPKGDTCTVTARPASNYHFFYWTENGETVSIDTTYSFTVDSDKNLVAHFEQVTPHWNVTTTGIPMVVLAVIEINDVEQRSDLLEVGAFCGTECRGTALANYSSDTDRFTVLLLVYGANGDELTFKLYDHRIGQELDLVSPSMNFSGGSVIGQQNDPYVLDFYYTQTITLAAGWNWISANVDITLDDLKAALVDVLPNSNEIIIKSKNDGITTYNGNRWRGRLESFDVAQMYRVWVSEACEITLEGLPVNPTEHPITISNGFNWIAFPFNENKTITNAFAGFAIEGDAVKSKDDGVANYNGTSWRGTLNTLVPGQGYIYNSNAAEDRILVFPAPAK